MRKKDDYWDYLGDIRFGEVILLYKTPKCGVLSTLTRVPLSLRFWREAENLIVEVMKTKSDVIVCFLLHLAWTISKWDVDVLTSCERTA